MGAIPIPATLFLCGVMVTQAAVNRLDCRFESYHRSLIEYGGAILSKILNDIEADLAWFFCPLRSEKVYRPERLNLTEREICLLEAQDKKTEDRMRKELTYYAHSDNIKEVPSI